MRILQVPMFVFAICLTSVYFVTSVEGADSAVNASSSLSYPSFKALDSSFENIMSKVQSIKAKIAKTLNETSSNRTRHELLLEEGYNFTAGMGYHKLHTVKQDWYGALRFCQRGGAHLAAIASSNERSALGKMLKQRGQLESQTEEVAYVGIHDYCKKGSWINVYFDVLDSAEYLQWEVGSPNYVQTSEVPNCVAVNGNGLLMNLSCTRKLPFFCKVGM
ncbi:hypothetical protein QAD02_017322 [Eretmocerus hayati]|uniref:Uncharacterized protein n=1 Tax=Eretmocerus hayati TaxID=131215 RepID=A0ACC2PDL7_9HYME|nr:hypothetical protein QAD02_017322 [Eretmocerus hayati]